MHHQHRPSDLLEVSGIIFEPRVDGCVMSEGTAGHALAPPVRNDRLRRLGSILVVAVERILRDETVELRPVAQHACPDRFSLPRYMFGVSEATSAAFATRSWWRAT